tara:strand:+ start:1065 stop:2630 length:1566 start_codon:yes stop_codon:yes gene_type:complete
MPIASSFFIEHIKNFALEISRAPEKIRIQQMEAAEQLLQELEENTLYPYDYIIYRVTGYRGDAVNQPALLGSALLGDIVALIATVSRTLDLSSTGMMNVKQAAKKLHVSLRTLSRLRREGLVFHWVLESNGRRRLGCSSLTLTKFAKHNEKRMKSASNFSRLSDEEKKEIVTFALNLKGENRSLSEVSVEVSKQSGRDHETIRLLLQQKPEVVQTFHQTVQLSRKDVRDIEQELRMGTSWKELEKRYQRTAGAIQKKLARIRSTRLKKLDISHVELDVFSREDAEEIILGAQVSQNVIPIILLLDSLDFPDENSILNNEVSIISAMHLLRRRAGLHIKNIGYSPPLRDLDRIESDLRWSFLLQQQLVVGAMPSSLSVAVQHVGRPLQELPANRLDSLLKHVIRVIGETCSKLDPSKGQTVQKTPASVLDRNLSLIDTYSKPLRAAAKYKTIELHCPFHQIVPWSFLLPTEDLPTLAKKTSDELEQIVSLRYGWARSPKTIEEIASLVGRSSIWITRQLRAW